MRLLRLSGKSNPGPPALQASTLRKEPFERPYLVAIRDLTCVATKSFLSHNFPTSKIETHKKVCGKVPSYGFFTRYIHFTCLS